MTAVKIIAGELNPDMDEAAFTSHLIGVARLLGYRIAHFRPALSQSGRWHTAVQGDGVGFPDIVCVHPTTGDRFVAELKSRKGKPTDRQVDWLVWFRAAGIDAFLWRPAQWLDIVDRLNQGAGV